MITGGDIKVGSPISYNKMKKILITKQDITNFGNQLYYPQGKPGHWYFLGSLRNRYAKFQTELSGKVKPIYFIWQAVNGIPPEGANIVLRKCLEEGCVNPEHLHNYTLKEVKNLKLARKIRVEGAKQLAHIKKAREEQEHAYELGELGAFVNKLETAIIEATVKAQAELDLPAFTAAGKGGGR